MTKQSLAVLILILSFSTKSFAWNYGENVQIVAVTLWENSGTSPLYFQRSDNVWCYVPAEEKNIYSIVLTLYASGKSANIHCYDVAEEKMAFPKAHKVHRILAH